MESECHGWESQEEGCQLVQHLSFLRAKMCSFGCVKTHARCLCSDKDSFPESPFLAICILFILHLLLVFMGTHELKSPDLWVCKFSAL